MGKRELLQRKLKLIEELEAMEEEEEGGQESTGDFYMPSVGLREFYDPGYERLRRLIWPRGH